MPLRANGTHRLPVDHEGVIVERVGIPALPLIALMDRPDQVDAAAARIEDLLSGGICGVDKMLGRGQILGVSVPRVAG
jgi:hypothetical protein